MIIITMRLISVLSLATTAAAIDAAIHVDSHQCRGRWIGCVNLEPQVSAHGTSDLSN